MRELDLREWSWMGKVDVSDLGLVFRHARRLKTLQLMSSIVKIRRRRTERSMTLPLLRSRISTG